MNPCMSQLGRACLRLCAQLNPLRIWMWPAIASAALCATLAPTPANALAPQYYYIEGGVTVPPVGSIAGACAYWFGLGTLKLTSYTVEWRQRSAGNPISRRCAVAIAAPSLRQRVGLECLCQHALQRSELLQQLSSAAGHQHPGATFQSGHPALSSRAGRVQRSGADLDSARQPNKPCDRQQVSIGARLPRCGSLPAGVSAALQQRIRGAEPAGRELAAPLRPTRGVDNTNERYNRAAQWRHV